jgi:hypothetical protein
MASRFRGPDSVQPRISSGCGTVFWMLAGFALTWPSRVESAGGPYAVDDADIGRSGSCQIENWLSSATSRDFVGTISPACVVTIGLPVEFTAIYQRSGTAEEWATAYGGAAKIVPINNDRFAFGLVGQVTADSLTNTTSHFINMPLTIKVAKDIKIHVNGGWLYDGRDHVDYVTGGAGFEWDFAPKFSIQGEVYLQGGNRLAHLPQTVHEPRTQLGIRYMPVHTVDIDVIYGQNLTGHGAHWLTLGLTMRTH